MRTRGPEPESDAPLGTAEPEVNGRIGPLLLLSVGLGVGGALAASLFLLAQTALQQAIWVDLPGRLGLGTSSWWYVVVALLVGALIVRLAQRLPGHTGGGPLEGFHFDTGPGIIVSVVVAALATLAFGMVLGPEAPLIACGTALGGLLLRGRDPKVVQLGMALGGVAAIGAIFGNPLVTAFMILEFAALGPLPAAALLPILVALGSGYVVQIGLGPWSGLGTHSLALPGLPAFTGLTGVELLGGAGVAVVATVVALGARELGERLQSAGRRWPTPVLFAAALFTALLAIGVNLATGQSYDAVLFSGQEYLGTLLAITSASTLLLVLLAKMLAYAAALGGGFRGGPIFPAVTLGVSVGVLAALVFPGLTLPGMVVVGIAATTASMTKLPFTGAMLAVLLASAAGPTVTPLAILGAVVGFIARMGLDRLDQRRSDVASTPASPALPA